MSSTSPASAADLKCYIEKKLGSDIVIVELSECQYEIVINDALQVFFDRIYDAYEKVYVPTILPAAGTASTCVVTLGQEILSVFSVYGMRTITSEKVMSFVYDPGNLLYNQQYTFEFSRLAHRLTVNNSFEIPTKVLLHVYRKLDSSEFGEIYNHAWVKKYAVALAKIQWGTNLTKFDSVVLPGQMRLNGDKILQQGTEEKREAEEELDAKWAFYPLPQAY